VALCAAITLCAAGCAAQPEQEAAIDRVAAEHAGDAPAPAAAAAGPAADGVRAQTLAYGRAGTRTLEGFVAWPDAAEEPRPAVILIHEWWGLNDNIREMARKFAAEGYVALAVDLYAGQSAGTPEQSRALMEQALADEHAIADNLRQAYAFATTSAQAPKVATVGWCFGGAMSLRAALLLSGQLDAAVIYYGMLVQDRERLAALDVPLLGLFAQLDTAIPPADVERFQQTLRALGKEAEFRIYPGADHAFANPSGTRYDAGAAADAWKRTLAFLAKHLQ
jgi:carboxymethylenebutenolidase